MEIMANNRERERVKCEKKVKDIGKRRRNMIKKEPPDKWGRLSQGNDLNVLKRKRSIEFIMDGKSIFSHLSVGYLFFNKQTKKSS